MLSVFRFLVCGCVCHVFVFLAEFSYYKWRFRKQFSGAKFWFLVFAVVRCYLV